MNLNWAGKLSGLIGLISIGYPVSSVVVKGFIIGYGYSIVVGSLLISESARNFDWGEVLVNRRLYFWLDKVFAAKSSAF